MLEAQLRSLRLGRASLVTKKHWAQEACWNTEPQGWKLLKSLSWRLAAREFMGVREGEKVWAAGVEP